MCIIVASANIFRRELTSFVLAEAGYDILEANDLGALVDQISRMAPRAFIVDSQLTGEPAAVLEAIRGQSGAPVLWLVGQDLAPPSLGGDCSPAEALAWPYQPEDLRARLTLLLGRAEAGHLVECARAVGGAE